MKKYPSGNAQIEYIGGWQYNLPFVDDSGYENSHIGFECKYTQENSILSFYNVQGLQDGMTKEEVLALADKLLEIGKLMK